MADLPDPRLDAFYHPLRGFMDFMSGGMHLMRRRLYLVCCIVSHLAEGLAGDLCRDGDVSRRLGCRFGRLSNFLFDLLKLFVHFDSWDRAVGFAGSIVPQKKPQIPFFEGFWGLDRCG